MDHDGAHKHIYILSEVQADLLRVAFPVWVEDLDLGGLTNVSAEFHDGAGKRLGDLVLRCPFKEGRLADGTRSYMLFLVEFQSTVDRRMGKRLRKYTGMLLDRLRRNGVPNREGGVPPVAALVVYNGERRWTAAGGEDDVARPASVRAARALAAFQPQVYRRIDERMKVAQHWPADNRVAATVRLQADRSVPDVGERLLRELRRFPGEEHRGLREGFHAWAKALMAEEADAVAFPSFEEFERAARPGWADEEEEMTTIAQAIHRQWVKDLRAEGQKQGIAIGEQKGIAIGEQKGIAIGERRAAERAKASQRDLLLRLARLRFGGEAAQLPELLADVTAREDLDRVADWVEECADAGELLSRVRNIGANGAGKPKRE